MNNHPHPHQTIPVNNIINNTMIDMDTATTSDNLASMILAILDKFSHPCILVGQAANRWMGCGGCIDEAIDLLVRDEQLELITAAFIASGHWGLFSPRLKLARPDKLEDSFLNYCCDADQVLQATATTHEWPFGYIRLWSEQTYHIKVDGPILIPIPALYHGQPLLAEADFHPTSDRADGWFFGPRKLSDMRISTASRADDNTLFILTIPAYLDALVYHTTRYADTRPSLALVSQWQIRNLTRYLYLELPDLRNQILFEVEGSTELFLESYFNNYKRKPFIVLNREGKAVYVERHRPESYPERWSGHDGKPHDLVEP